MKLQPIDNAPFGVIASGFDCASADLESIKEIRSALHRDQIVVLPGQAHLTPQQEVAFYRLIYPGGSTVWRDQTHNRWERYKVEQGNKAGTYQIPKVPGVLVIGKGDIDHYGLKVTLGGDRAAYGEQEGSQVLGGGVLQWHIDGAFYEHAPGHYTQMRCIETPAGKGHWLTSTDDEKSRLWCPAGSTAFASGRIAYDLMPSDVRQRCLHTQVHYLPRPFEATYGLGNSNNGLRVVDPEAEARFKKESESPGTAFNDPMAQIYPLVWTCPATKFQALMPQPRCLSCLETETDSEPVFLGITESRHLAESWMRPAIATESVYVHAWQPGDLVIWHNRSVWHSATGELARDDRRVMHLTAYNSSEAPVCMIN